MVNNFVYIEKKKVRLYKLLNVFVTYFYSKHLLGYNFLLWWCWCTVMMIDELHLTNLVSR